MQATDPGDTDTCYRFSSVWDNPLFGRLQTATRLTALATNLLAAAVEPRYPGPRCVTGSIMPAVQTASTVDLCDELAVCEWRLLGLF